MKPKDSWPFSQERATAHNLIYFVACYLWSHTISFRFSSVLSSNLRLGSVGGLVPSGFRTKVLFAHLIFPTRAACPVHFILLDLITLHFSLVKSTNYEVPLNAILLHPVSCFPNPPIFTHSTSMRSSRRICWYNPYRVRRSITGRWNWLFF
jgi:hypothetical protein